MHSSWTLKWIRPEAAQPLQLSKTSRIAAICSDTQVLCTTAVTCTDSICWLTPPLVSAEAAETVINFLLQQLKKQLPDTGCKQLLLLLNPAEDDRGLPRCLTQAGFQRLAEIASFQLAAGRAAELRQQSTAWLNMEVIRLQMNMPAIPMKKLQALQSLITAASSDSTDLSRLPAPEFQQQWQEWQLASATILAASDDTQQYTGLCVLAADSETSPLPGSCRIRILWLAVRSDCRRKGIASAILKAAAQLVMSAPAKDSSVTLSADVDLENLAAIKLYSRCGFQRCGRTLELWGT